MSNLENYQLPDGIHMPDRYTRRLSFQMWFYAGVQVGLEGSAPQDEGELTQRFGSGNAAAYQAGVNAGRAKRDTMEAHAQQISVPEEYSRSLQERIWFLKGVDDGSAGQPYERPPGLPHKRSAELLAAYRAGYVLGMHHGN